MDVGLLVCDNIDTELHQDFPDYKALYNYSFPNLNFSVYNLFENNFPSDISLHQVYFMTGSRYSVYDKLEWIKLAKSFIQRLRSRSHKFVGLCFGHQMLAEALGGKVEKSALGWNVGIKDFTLVKKPDWMQHNSNKVSIHMMCQDQVISLPPGSEILATRPDCPIGMIQCGNMLGIQGHPEFNTPFAKRLLLGRSERIGIEKVTTALESFESAPNLQNIKSIIDNFIQE